MKQHYSKIISACCFLFVFVNIGLPSTSFSVYQPYIVALPGISDSGGSLVLSVRTAFTLIAMFVVNAYYTRLDCRLAVTGGCAMVSAGFGMYAVAAQAASLPLFFVGAVLAGLGYGLGGNVAVALLTGRWYKSRVGTAVGFAAVGSGVAGMVIPPLALTIITNISLSAAFGFEAVLTAVVGVVVFLLIRNNPEDIGAHPYGEEEDRAQQKDTTGKPTISYKPLSSAEGILILLACAGVGMFCVGAYAYLSILLTSNSYDPVFAAFGLSIAGFTLTVSKFVTGVVFDKFGTLRGTAIVFILSIISLGLLCLAPVQSPLLMGVALAFYGAGASTGSTGISTWSIELSTPRQRTKLIRNMQIGYSIGGFVGGTFPGFLMEFCGSYVPSFAIIFLTTVFSAVVLITVYRRRSRPAAA